MPLCLSTPLDHISSKVQIKMRWGPCRWSCKRVEKATQRGGCRVSIVIRIMITTVVGVGHAEKGERQKKSGGWGKHFAFLNCAAAGEECLLDLFKITSPQWWSLLKIKDVSFDLLWKSLWKPRLSSYDVAVYQWRKAENFMCKYFVCDMKSRRSVFVSPVFYARF